MVLQDWPGWDREASSLVLAVTRVLGALRLPLGRSPAAPGGLAVPKPRSLAEVTCMAGCPG